MLSDAFICHASEDKEGFVRPLAERLREQHVEVWYDEFSLNVGDSLRRSIDQGLSQSRFAIVVLSPSFFSKQWSQWELDGIVAHQNSGKDHVILPIWHGLQHGDLTAYSPSLADKLAIPSDVGIEEVLRRLLTVIRPQGSTLVVARDHLIERGFRPPVVTDDWWLDVAASAESNDMEGSFQEPMGWGRWGFPLPAAEPDPVQRGWRLASAAMQTAWQREVEQRPITQVTHPDIVHEFIRYQPGLLEACHDHVRYLIAYAPQLAIRGFGGEFEDVIESLYQQSGERGERRRAAGDHGGAALTTDGLPPKCDDEYALRDPEFGRYDAAHIACGFVQGNYVANGPPVMYYGYIDYAAWLLSDDSVWLPPQIREALTNGMAEWGVWPWHERDRVAIEDLGFEEASFTGKFAESLESARTYDDIDIGLEARRDLVYRLSFSARLLRLPEDAEQLAERLLSADFLGLYLDRRNERLSRD